MPPAELNWIVTLGLFVEGTVRLILVRDPRVAPPRILSLTGMDEFPPGNVDRRDQWKLALFMDHRRKMMIGQFISRAIQQWRNLAGGKQRCIDRRKIDGIALEEPRII